MRIWDLAPHILCRVHLLGEHRELHALWSILTQGKSGYRNHPETKRWVGKTRALYLRHEELVKEMTKRGYSHRSPLSDEAAQGSAEQKTLIHSVAEQRAILQRKQCNCLVNQ